ncbi:MAG: hypothetical protein IKT33_03400 [Clostridia bacterium]|nr:hypothetical protein [Clostridia bacterium]
MSDFFKRNFVWISILLCITGIVLSIIGIPVGKPIFFFIGIVLSLPTLGYLIYQLFFDQGEAELNLVPTTIKANHSNITSIITKKKDILLTDENTNEDDFESLYHGFANEQEIKKKLHEITNNERERTLLDLPEIIIPEAEPFDDEDDDFNDYEDDFETDETTEIETATNEELYRQRQAVLMESNNFEPEIPTELNSNEINDIKEETMPTQNETTFFEETPIEAIQNTENIIENQKVTNIYDIDSNYTPSLIDPNFVPGDPVMPQTNIPITKNTIIRINLKNAELRKQKAEEKKSLLSQANLERYLQRYFVETAACFLMDRNLYKDAHGIAPYNKYAINKDTGLPEYSIASTKGRLYKFCSYLIDAERFITQSDLYDEFTNAVERGVSLARVSESLHPLYRKKHKKDFILNLSNREDWDNVIILVYNNYILNNDNFKDVFTRVPFEIPVAFNEQNIIDYLKDTDIHDRFADRFPALEEIGVPTLWDSLYICFINSIKSKLTIDQLEDAILRNYKKIARALKRIDNARRKKLKTA